MKQKSTALARNILFALLCSLFLIPTAHADMGPKPALTITVVNAPAGTLYLDLLTEGEPAGHPYFSDSDAAKYDPGILANLHSLEGEGWVLAYCTGVDHMAPVFGDLAPGEDGTWRFSYSGLPGTFRIAAATEDRVQVTKKTYTRSFIDEVVYDWESNTVRAATPKPVRFMAEVLVTLIPTLLIEGLILFLFGFREKRTWLVFLAVNVLTQLALHIFCGNVLLFAGSHFLLYALFLLIPELVIWAAEAAAFALLFRERTVGRRIGYAVCANAVSFILGYVPVFFWTIFTVL